MKQFEKWYLPDKDIYIDEYKMQEAAWRAALEWALTQDTDINATELAYAIEKELVGDR